MMEKEIRDVLREMLKGQNKASGDLLEFIQIADIKGHKDWVVVKKRPKKKEHEFGIFVGNYLITLKKEVEDILVKYCYNDWVEEEKQQMTWHPDVLKKLKQKNN